MFNNLTGKAVGEMAVTYFKRMLEMLSKGLEI
jgi:hypothetical protein